MKMETILRQDFKLDIKFVEATFKILEVEENETMFGNR